MTFNNFKESINNYKNMNIIVRLIFKKLGIQIFKKELQSVNLAETLLFIVFLFGINSCIENFEYDLKQNIKIKNHDGSNSNSGR